MEGENNNEEIKLGMVHTTSENKSFQRRSSMKQHRSSIKEPGMNVPKNPSFKRQITWNEDAEEVVVSPEKKYRDSKTFYSDSSVKNIFFIMKKYQVDRTNDVYLQKLSEINKIETTVKFIIL